MTPKKDITGERFGMLTVLRDTGKRTPGKGVIWECKCDCGNLYNVCTGSLRSGGTTSCGCKQYRSDKELGINILWSRYKIKAKKRGIAFLLPKARFKELILSSCYLCGQIPNTPVNYKGRELILYNGIDRIDSNKPYTEENSISCCWTCNRAKGNLSVAQYRMWLKQSYLHIFGKITDKTPGELIDQLATVTVKCFYEQEKIMNMPETSSETSKAAKRAQELNAKRNKLIRSIDILFNFEEDTPTEKTYG